MNKIILTLLLAFFTSELYAERTHRSDSVTKAEINQSIQSVLNAVGIDGYIDKTVFAVGTQEYFFDGTEIKASGPKANLFRLRDRKRYGKRQVEKIGFHNQNFATPSWELVIRGVSYEFIAKKATPVAGAGDQDVAWLYVELEPNDLYCAIVRTETRAGKPSNNTNLLPFVHFGIGYETIYSFIVC